MLFREDDKVVHNEHRGYIENLDDLPFIDYSIIGGCNLRSPFFSGNYKNPYLIFSSRGCVNRCKYCAVHNKKYRYRSPKNVIDEYERLINEYGAGYLQFADAMFMGHTVRSIEICEEIIRRKLNRVPWNCEAHINFITPDLLKIMKKSGCESVFCFRRTFSADH